MSHVFGSHTFHDIRRSESRPGRHECRHSCLRHIASAGDQKLLPKYLDFSKAQIVGASQLYAHIPALRAGSYGSGWIGGCRLMAAKRPRPVL